MTIVLRMPGEIYQESGHIENGTFHGHWHFSFGDSYDPEHMNFGTLRVFNDDTLSPGATWLLHPHRQNEVVTYCAAGEFRHADENGVGGILRQGGVQHTTVGRGMWHSEINNRPDEPMRFIQMWFFPLLPDLEPAVQQKQTEKEERTGRWLPMVASDQDGALPINADAAVYAALLPAGGSLSFALGQGRGVYLYVLEGGPVALDGEGMTALAAAMIQGQPEFTVTAEDETELLLAEAALEVQA